MKKIAKLILMAGTVSVLRAQPPGSPLLVPYTMAGTYSSAKDVFSLTSNPAALAGATSPVAGLYADRKFMLRELSNFVAAFALPVRHGGLGFCINYFGFDQFSNTALALEFGRKLGKSIELGCQFTYHLIHAGSYGNAHTLTAGAGMRWRLSEKLRTGFFIYNPAGGKFGPDGMEKLAAVYSMGLSYEPSPDLFIGMAISKEEDRPVDIGLALEYNFERRLFGRVGINSSNAGIFGGLGIAWHMIRADFVVSWQQVLGMTPGLMLLMGSGSAKKGEEP